MFLNLLIDSKRKTPLVLGVIFPLLFCLSCQNLYSSIAEDTDESLLFEAQILMNDGQWDEAVAKFGEMSDDFQTKRSTRLELAKAYAGQCGLDFLSLIQTLDGGVSSIFDTLMESFNGASTTTITACINGETTIHAISTDPTARTGDENLTMAFIAFAKIGTILNTFADTDDDGTTEWGNDDSCTTGNLPQLYAQHLATGFAIALDSLSNSGGSFAGTSQSDLDDMCTSISGIGATYDFCGVYDVNNITADMETAIRTIVQEGNDGIGLGSCTASPNDVSNCVCP